MEKQLKINNKDDAESNFVRSLSILRNTMRERGIKKVKIDLGDRGNPEEIIEIIEDIHKDEKK